MDYKGIITIEPGKRGGKPCIRGLRITVYDVLEYLAGGMTPDQIVADFPDLTTQDIQACLHHKGRTTPVSTRPKYTWAMPRTRRRTAKPRPSGSHGTDAGSDPAGISTRTVRLPSVTAR